MRGVTRAIALLGGLAAYGLLFSSSIKAADLSPVTDAPGLLWYGSLLGGPKWSDGGIKVQWQRENEPCYLSSVICALQPLVHHDGELHGEVEDGFIFGGTFGAKVSEHFRGEIEVSGARLDSESQAFEYVSYSVPPTGTNYKAEDEEHLRELFILTNAWFDFQLSSRFCTYLGGGIGVAHIDGEFGTDPFATGMAQVAPFSASVKADDWAFAYQLGAGLLIGLSQHVGIDVGYRFKAITDIELDDPQFCSGEHCFPLVVDFKTDDDFNIHEHVAQIGLIVTF
jgi:opacity protein-like surface antigen